jgi:hypothetical protein
VPSAVHSSHATAEPSGAHQTLEDVADLDGLDDHDVLGRTVATVGLGGRDVVDDVEPVGRLAEHVVLTAAGRSPGADEELRPVGVRAGVRHRQRAQLVTTAAGAVELVGELVARPAGAGAGRVAALDHEARMTRWKITPS